MHFSFSSGAISCITMAEGVIEDIEILHTYEQPRAEHYGDQEHNKRRFIAHAVRTLSILDVYAYIFHLGTRNPGTLNCLLVASHAWDDGPILLNSMDPFPQLPWHSPADKDARRKDLRSPQLSRADTLALRRAFSPTGFCVNAGCGGYKHHQALLLSAGSGATWSGADIKELANSASQCWNQAFADAAGIPCFGAFPGFATGLELQGDQPTLSVPLQAIADRPDFTPALRAIEQTLGVQRDPWNLGLVRFSPTTSWPQRQPPSPA